MARVRWMSSEDIENAQQELERLRAAHRQIRDLLTLIQELTSRVVRSESAAELFRNAFPTLLPCVPFDIAVAVMIEQNLELHIATRGGAESLVDEQLMHHIRETLASHIPVSFETTEIVV